MNLAELKKCERVIQKGLSQFVAVGEALEKIRIQKAYRLRKFATFEEYCDSTFGFGAKRGYQIIEEAAIARLVKSKTGVDIPNAAMARALKPLQDHPELLPEIVGSLLVGQKIPTVRAVERKASIVIATASAKRTQRKIRQLLANKTKTPKKFGDVVRIECNDFQKFLPTLPPQSVDLILTDPPWNREFIEKKYPEKLSALAKQVLKPDGLLAVMTGNIFSVDWLNGLSKHMPYRWTLTYVFDGATKFLIQENVKPFWKPVFVFGGRQRRIKSDVVNLTRAANPDVLMDEMLQAEKDYHVWGQNEFGFRKLVKLLSKPGDTVLDPFCGQGTTLLAAIFEEDGPRKVIGCDLNCQNVEVSKEQCRGLWSVLLCEGHDIKTFFEETGL